MTMRGEDKSSKRHGLLLVMCVYVSRWAHFKIISFVECNISIKNKKSSIKVHDDLSSNARTPKMVQ